MFYFYFHKLILQHYLDVSVQLLSATFQFLIAKIFHETLKYYLFAKLNVIITFER